MSVNCMAEIEDVAARFRAGEAEVARTFFSQPRPLAQHLFWLKSQVSRELRNLREISQGELSEQVDKVDRGMTREAIVAELREHYYETRHYAMLAYVLEGLGGAHVDWKDLDAERATRIGPCGNAKSRSGAALGRSCRRCTAPQDLLTAVARAPSPMAWLA